MPGPNEKSRDQNPGPKLKAFEIEYFNDIYHEFSFKGLIFKMYIYILFVLVTSDVRSFILLFSVDVVVHEEWGGVWVG